MPERLEYEVLQKARYINTLTSTFFNLFIGRKSGNLYTRLYLVPPGVTPSKFREDVQRRSWPGGSGGPDIYIYILQYSSI